MKPIDIAATIAIARKEASLAISGAIPLIADMVPIPENGKDGNSGRDGKDGRDGIDGKDGRNGVDGMPGAKGDQGPRGEKGDKGDKGKTGDVGPRGPKGKDGKDGSNGVGIRDSWVDPDDGRLYVELTNGRTIDAGIVKGKDGKDGKDGAIIIGGGGGGSSSGGGAGTPGADGASAYEVAVENGFTGTESEWLASLVGPQGPAGADGPAFDPWRGEWDALAEYAANDIVYYNGSSYIAVAANGPASGTPETITIDQFSQSTNYGGSGVALASVTNMTDGLIDPFAATNSGYDQFIRMHLDGAQYVASVNIGAASTIGGWGAVYLNGCYLEYSTNGSAWIFVAELTGFANSQIKNVVVNKPNVTDLRIRGNSFRFVNVSEFSPIGSSGFPDASGDWELVASIGATGPAGPAGATGATGPAGATGETGPQGEAGTFLYNIDGGTRAEPHSTIFVIDGGTE